ncbi:hypothetical protein NDU88_001278 [Pleurodeles waltl]|uniref:Uncharacterized protein n=1 Tax=Pleurodeles waltl TaxID=8319 RepID=A0AAV7LZ81_PLEWA|nr:hypothetical protein NDU88_001278 [Pleurodeles waltl]
MRASQPRRQGAGIRPPATRTCRQTSGLSGGPSITSPVAGSQSYVAPQVPTTQREMCRPLRPRLDKCREVSQHSFGASARTNASLRVPPTASSDGACNL